MTAAYVVGGVAKTLAEHGAEYIANWSVIDGPGKAQLHLTLAPLPGQTIVDDRSAIETHLDQAHGESLGVTFKVDF